jgi:hypothetical protein
MSAIGSATPLKRRAIFGKSLRDIAAVMVMAFLFTTLGAKADTTNDLSDAEMQGRALAEKILDQHPTQNYTNAGVLRIRGPSRRADVPVQFEVLAHAKGWCAMYETRITNAVGADPSFGRSYFSELTITHSDHEPNVYLVPNVNPPPTDTNSFYRLVNDQIASPFALSDFWICDLGLEFFHWPQQKVLKKEFHRQCPCTVLESTNPNPSANAYSRVVCWIDNDSLGIVEAYAYDASGKKLKNFYPKNLQKVDGQYQVESMVMENLQTGSKSTLEFDLDK